MNKFEITYDGNLRTSAVHLESGSKINTDAPKDNQGLGQKFSPTDLVCVSLASCMLTIMGIAMQKYNIDLLGTTASVKKTMGVEPRMISQIDITIKFTTSFDEKIKTILERSAHNCPVHKSLSTDIKKNITFIYS
tara:strand:- start:1954 stop:2358 length:405 start_codon:yes stop_codon:yes gene_type:complete